MRLLNTTNLEFQSGEHTKFRQEGYAVLSHRWLPQEITLDQFGSHVVEELKSGSTVLSPQLDKIRGTCETAHNKGIKWVWIDSCCIDKRDLVETAKSINAMYRWYRDSILCIVYLYDVKKNAAISIQDPHIFDRLGQDKPSEWFSRGWTLQELLAPRQMEFYDKEWTYIGSKKKLRVSIASVSGIDESYLTGKNDFREACIAQKMSWMSGRTTTKEEDIAYGMIGLFGITLMPVYGEGMRAFTRLQENLMSSRFMDESLFAWKMPTVNAGDQYNESSDEWAADEWGLLAPSPEWFASSAGIRAVNILPSRQVSFTMEPTGVKGPVTRNPCSWRKVRGLNLLTFVGFMFGIIPGVIADIYNRHLVKKFSNEDFTLILNCVEVDASGSCEVVGISLRPTRQVKKLRQIFTWGPNTSHFTRTRSTEFGPVPMTAVLCSEVGHVRQPMLADC